MALGTPSQLQANFRPKADKYCHIQCSYILSKHCIVTYCTSLHLSADHNYHHPILPVITVASYSSIMKSIKHCKDDFSINSNILFIYFTKKKVYHSVWYVCSAVHCLGCVCVCGYTRKGGAGEHEIPPTPAQRKGRWVMCGNSANLGPVAGPWKVVGGSDLPEWGRVGAGVRGEGLHPK